MSSQFNTYYGLCPVDIDKIKCSSYELNCSKLDTRLKVH